MHTCVWMLVAAALLHTLTLHADCKRFDQHGCSPELHERIAHDDRAAHAQLWAQCPCDAATLAISNVDVRIENGHLAVAGAVASTPFRKSYKLPNGAVPEKVAVVYTKGHVVSITCPMQPQSAPYQRSIPVALEQAAKTLSEPSVNTNPGANASHAEENAPVAQQPQQRQNQKAQRWPHQLQHQHQHYQPVKSHQRPELEKREWQRQREQEPQQTPRWQREETNGRSKGAAAQASSKRQHHQQQSHSNRENRKDYVRAPPRECAGRYCRRNWHGTHGPHSVAPRRDEEDVVVFVADEAKGHNETGAGPAVFSVSEILQEEGELDVEKYIKAIEVDLARIKNVV